MGETETCGYCDRALREQRVTDNRLPDKVFCSTDCAHRTAMNQAELEDVVRYRSRIR